MHCLLVAALTLSLMGSAAAAEAVDPPRIDPLQSSECRRALESLQVQEETSAAAPRASGPGARERAPDANLASKRRLAAQACLASRADPPVQAQRGAQPPIAVSPVTVARPAARPAAPMQPPGPALPKPADRPTFIMSCDAVGCWGNDGSRLNRMGPELWGPRGACTVQGALLQCP